MRSNLKHVIVVVMGIISITVFILQFFLDNNFLTTLGITLITTFYQGFLRPYTGLIIHNIYHNKMNFNKWWFKERKFESTLYKILGVRKWKNKMPTYDPDAFNIYKHSLEEVIGATCQAEIVHELMLVESLFPLLLIISFGEPLVFILTTLLCVIIESVFIIMQRYNRPRLVRVYNMKVHKNN
ncbi:MAG: hypothetical protein ACI311_01360 [Bacilli bacterium]